MSQITQNRKKLLIDGVYILLSAAVFLFSIDLMGEAFRNIGESTAKSILVATSNPFIGLFIGLLVTAIIQSSSTSTSMIVAIMASGSITLSEAVPMIMGANIGTTLTSTIVSLGFITKPRQFKRAVAAGTLHDFYNILTVMVLFPLEYYYGMVSNLAETIASLLVDTDSPKGGAFGFKLFDVIPFGRWITEILNNNFITIILSFILLFGSIKVFSNVIYKKVVGSEDRVNNVLFKSTFKSFLLGTGMTALVQSSSITTSLAVPFVAAGRLQLDRAAPFIIGANIGTTITAFIAVLFESSAAMSIAVTHLLFNLFGVFVFLPFKPLRTLHIKIADMFGRLTIRYRLTGLVYIVLTFFLIPFTLIYFNKDTTEIKELTYKVESRTKNYEKKVLSLKTHDTKNSFFSDFETKPSQKENNHKNVLNVSLKQDVLFLNNNYYLKKKKNYCWDDEDQTAKFKMCIVDILPKWRINDNVEVDSVFVFEKRYYQPIALDSAYEHHLISVNEQLLVGRESYDKNGILISKESLIEIKIQ